MDYPKTINEIMNEQAKPVIWANEQGLIAGINAAFTLAFGWNEEDLKGKSLTEIMPPKFRELHQIGFSRFLATEQSKVAGKPLALAIIHKDGTEEEAEHFILAEKDGAHWNFAATITPS